MTSLVGYKPIQLSLPEKFAQFRPAQIEAADHVLNSPYRFNPLTLPLGAGKSLIAMAIAKASGLRTVILTATRGLMNQYELDFNSAKLVSIKGRANYTCAHWPHLDCRYGALEGCPLVDGGGCNYEGCRDNARIAPIVLSNYAYWFHVNEYPPGLDDPPQFDEDDGRPVQQLILDEAHQSPSELSQYLRVEVKGSWLPIAGIPFPRQSEDISAWRELALNSIVKVTRLVADATKQLKLAVTNHSLQLRRLRDEVYRLDALKNSLVAISVMNKEDWVLEVMNTRQGMVWVFDNVWPAQHNFKLFRNIPKIILMSGTYKTSTSTLLGIPKQYNIKAWSPTFPPNHTPVYHIPTIRLNHDMNEMSSTGEFIDQAKWDKWLKRIDEIIESRLYQKGIIHTVSHDRQRYLKAHSRFAEYFHTNTDDDLESIPASEVVAKFKAADAPAILVSASFSTGWDFPNRCCEWQIIAKVPYPAMNSKVVKARIARMKSYAAQVAIQDLEQACGRGTRSHWDRCEIFIIDDAILGLLHYNKGLKSNWFSIIPMNQVPPPGPRCPE